jgi:hypothetical protein
VHDDDDVDGATLVMGNVVGDDDDDNEGERAKTRSGREGGRGV